MIFDPFLGCFWPHFGSFLTPFLDPPLLGGFGPPFLGQGSPPLPPPLGGQKTSQKGEKWGPLEGGVPPLTWVPPLLFWKTVKTEKMPYKCPIFFGFIVFLALFSIVLTRFGGRGGQNGVFLTRFWGVLDPFFDPPGAVGIGPHFYHFGDTFLFWRRNFLRTSNFFSEKKFCWGAFNFVGSAFLDDRTNRFWNASRYDSWNATRYVNATACLWLAFGITPTSERMTEQIVYETLRVILAWNASRYVNVLRVSAPLWDNSNKAGMTEHIVYETLRVILAWNAARYVNVPRVSEWSVG